MKIVRYLPLFLLFVLLPVMLLRDFTPANELRYLSIADEAMRDGNIFTFYNQGMPYADKPPLYLWLVMLGKLIFGGHFMPYLAMLSVVPAMVIIGVMNRWIAPRVTQLSRRFMAGLMMMSSGLFLGLAFTLRMDMMMCMFIVLALYTFYRIYDGRGRSVDRMLFPVYVFLAVFSKGAVGILVPLVCTVVFLAVVHRLSTVGRYWGWRTWSVLLALCCVWFTCVYMEGGRGYLDNLLFHQTVDRAVNSFHHKEPFYYYGMTFWYSLAPWSLLIVATIVEGVRRHAVNDDMEKFFLTVAATTLAMLSCISSKIEIYLAPAFPFFVYFAVVMLSKLRWNRLLAWCVGIPAAVFLCGLPAVAVLALYDGGVEWARNVWIVAGAASLSLGGGATLGALSRGRSVIAVNSLALGFLMTFFIAGWAMPRFNPAIGYGDMARAGRELAAENGTGGYCTFEVRRAENMDVYLGEDLEAVGRDDILSGRCGGKVLFFRVRNAARDEELMEYLDTLEFRTFGKFAVAVLPVEE